MRRKSRTLGVHYIDISSINYFLTTIDGKVFDESKDAVAFPLNGVIRGWTEGLQLFPEGSKFELYIPANLGYGEHSPSPAIPANSVLIFEIELVEIVKPEAAK